MINEKTHKELYLIFPFSVNNLGHFRIIFYPLPQIYQNSSRRFLKNSQNRPLLSLKAVCGSISP